MKTEDTDDLADTSLILCSGRHGLSVILPDSDIVGEHVHGSKRAILAKQVRSLSDAEYSQANVPGGAVLASSGYLSSVHG